MPSRDPYDDDDRPDDRDRDRNRDRDPDRENYDDYEGPRRGSRAWAAQKVSMPAIFLMIVAGLGLAMAILNIAVEALGLGGPNPFADPAKANDPDQQAAQRVGKWIGGVIQIVWVLIVFTGGLQMKRLQGWGYVLFACIWAMLPCNLLCLLGIPFGIWGLVVLNDEGVKRAFRTPPRTESY
jgi:hypothetical protein